MAKQDSKTSAKKTTAKKSNATKKPAVKRAPAKKTVSISFQGVGSLPTTIQLEQGMTLEKFKASQELGGYTISVNGSTVADSYVFSKDDVVRIGLKTKNGR